MNKEAGDLVWKKIRDDAQDHKIPEHEVQRILEEAYGVSIEMWIIHRLMDANCG
jgi:hypothetical protein